MKNLILISSLLLVASSTVACSHHHHDKEKMTQTCLMATSNIGTPGQAGEGGLQGDCQAAVAAAEVPGGLNALSTNPLVQQQMLQQAPGLPGTYACLNTTAALGMVPTSVINAKAAAIKAQLAAQDSDPSSPNYRAPASEADAGQVAISPSIQTSSVEAPIDSSASQGTEGQAAQ